MGIREHGKRQRAFRRLPWRRRLALTRGQAPLDAAEAEASIDFARHQRSPLGVAAAVGSWSVATGVAFAINSLVFGARDQLPWFVLWLVVASITDVVVQFRQADKLEDRASDFFMRRDPWPGDPRLGVSSGRRQAGQ